MVVVFVSPARGLDFGEFVMKKKNGRIEKLSGFCSLYILKSHQLNSTVSGFILLNLQTASCERIWYFTIYS